MAERRALRFLGRSYEDPIAFPATVRKAAGDQLRMVQFGDQPTDWKPMKTIGAGVNEIRVHDPSGAFRVIYIAKLKDAVYVLHCFEKKSQKTSLQDLRIASARYKDLIAGRAHHHRATDR